jgi:hypothetical protein
MVAGQSCIAGPSVFPLHATLNLPVCCSSGVLVCQQTRGQQMLPAGDSVLRTAHVYCAPYWGQLGVADMQPSTLRDHGYARERTGTARTAVKQPAIFSIVP